MKSLNDLNKRLEQARHNKNEIEQKLLSLDQRITQHQQQIDMMRSTVTATTPYWTATMDSWSLHRPTCFIYGGYSDIPGEENNFVFGQVWQGANGTHRTVFRERGSNQRPPAVSRIKLTTAHTFSNVHASIGAAVGTMEGSQIISYWSSGYSTQDFFDDTEYMYENARPEYEYFPRQATLWNPIGHVIGLAGYCASPFVGAGILAGTTLLDGVALIDSFMSSSASAYGKFTSITIGQQRIKLNTREWDSDQSNEFSSAIARIDASERSICSITAVAPFGPWNRANFTVEVYVALRDMPDTPTECQKLQHQFMEFEQKKIKLMNALQNVSQQIKKIETAISQYKSPAYVKATIFGNTHDVNGVCSSNYAPATNYNLSIN